MDQFVCVRMPQVNRLNFHQFQFDFDLTFAVFFMHSDGTVYGRFGTRSRRDKPGTDRAEADADLTLDGLAAAMSGALKLHEKYPANKKYLAGKQAVPGKYKTPNDIPSLRGKYKDNVDYEGQAARSCVHCHQIVDAQRLTYRSAGKPIPDELVFPYPAPSTVGIELDNKTRASVSKVAERSAGHKAGIQVGDDIVALEGQAILSLTDIQWVLHHAEETDELRAMLRRGGELVNTTIKLEAGWRRASDITWRVSSWDLRRMGTGGLKVEPASQSDRRKAKVDASQMALLVNHVGQYGAHGVAKRAGFRKGDIIISYDGQTDLMTSTDLLAYAAQHTKRGEKISVNVIRGGKQMEMTLTMQ